jgi:putative transcriptional regulator
MHRAVMGWTEWHRELVARVATQRTRLDELQVVSVRRLACTQEADEPQMFLVARKLAMVLPNTVRISRRRPMKSKTKSRNLDRFSRGRSRAEGSRVGDDLVAAFEEMAKHLRGEIDLEAHEAPSSALTPAHIKAIRLKVASSTKEFERLFGIPARTMESYEQGRRKLDGPMRALLRIIDREPKAGCRALAG